MEHLSPLSITLCIIYITTVLCYHKHNNLNSLRAFKNFAAKYDPTTFVKVSVNKPLGLELEEVEDTKSRGVYVSKVNEGNAKLTQKIYSGLYLLQVNGKDVKGLTFDVVMSELASAQSPLQLVFIDPRNISRGPATVTVHTPDGKKKTITTVKGALLRQLLLDAGIELYPGAAKLTNCGGGGSCGTCVVSVFDNTDWEPRPDFEAKRLKKYDSSCRLSCNTVVEGDVSVGVNPQKIVS